MRVTSEFGNYKFIGDPFPLYVRRTARRIREINGRWRILGPTGQYSVRSRRVNHVANLRTAATHLLRLARHGGGPVTLSALVTEARKNRPETRVVGDKFPRYLFELDRFVELPELLRLVIYRDCRDVTNSYLGMIRSRWKPRPWVHDANTAEKIAQRWVRAIEIMERHADHLFVIRYEDLVGNPQSELKRLAEWLDVDPSGFNAKSVYDTSVGKYKRGLTGRELDDVLRVAGPALERLKYPLD
jgi:hypothetical protein